MTRMPFITVIKGERIESGPVVRAPIIRVPLWLAALGLKHWCVTGPGARVRPSVPGCG